MKKYSKLMPLKMRFISRRLHTEAPYPVAAVRTLFRFYVYDWLALVALAVLDGLLNVINPFYRFVGQFDINNVRYPFKSSTIPSAAVPVIAVIVPFVIIFAYFIFKRDLQDLHHAILGLLFAVLITAVLTDAIKDAVGRPRPDFFWRCFPDGNAIYDSVTQQVLCTGRETDIKEGHKSFPSGHTSWSFAGLGYLSLYLAGKLELVNRRGHVGKSIVVLLPLLGAALVGASCVSDYWHHWEDVFAGGFLGMVMAIFCYHQLFPWLHEPDCMHAYPFNAINCAHYENNLPYWPSSFDASPLGEDRGSYVEIPST